MLLGIIEKSENSRVIEVLRCILYEFDGDSVVVNAMMVPMYMDRKSQERKNWVWTSWKLNDLQLSIGQVQGLSRGNWRVECQFLSIFWLLYYTTLVFLKISTWPIGALRSVLSPSKSQVMTLLHVSQTKFIKISYYLK